MAFLANSTGTNSIGTTIQPLHPHYNYKAKVRAETILPGPYSEGLTIQLDEDGMIYNNRQAHGKLWQL